MHSWIFPCLPSTFLFVLFWMRLAEWCLDLLRIFLCIFSFWHHYFCRKYWKDSWNRTFWEKRGKWQSGKLTFLLSLRARKDLNRRFAKILFDAKLSVFSNVWNPAFLLESFQLKQLCLWFASPIFSPLWQLDRVPIHGCSSIISISSAISDLVWQTSGRQGSLGITGSGWSQPSFSSRTGTASSALPDKCSAPPADRGWLAPLPVTTTGQWGKAFVPTRHLSTDKCRIGAWRAHTCQVSLIMDMDFKLE